MNWGLGILFIHPQIIEMNWFIHNYYKKDVWFIQFIDSSPKTVSGDPGQQGHLHLHSGGGPRAMSGGASLRFFCGSEFLGPATEQTSATKMVFQRRVSSVWKSGTAVDFFPGSQNGFVHHILGTPKSND